MAYSCAKRYICCPHSELSWVPFSFSGQQMMVIKSRQQNIHQGYQFSTTELFRNVDFERKYKAMTEKGVFQQIN